MSFSLLSEQAAVTEHDDVIRRYRESLPRSSSSDAQLHGRHGIRSHAHFRYPVDGVWSDFDKIFDATLDEIFGQDSPNSPQNRWVRKLHHFGLIR
jgi:hypothetical protein